MVDIEYITDIYIYYYNYSKISIGGITKGQEM